MRNILVICSLLISNLSTNVIAQERPSGIRFSEGTWKELLEYAKVQGKVIFVDVYTDWCGPCKRMDSEVFPLAEVGNFYNDNFISHRLNAEKGEGPVLAKKYGVKVYPTWLFVDAEGILIQRSTGYLEADALIALGKSALRPTGAAKKLALMQKRFEAGERNADFLQEYLDLRTINQLDNSTVLDVYVPALGGKGLDEAAIRRLIDYAGRSWSAAIPRISVGLLKFEDRELREMAKVFFNNSLYYIWGNAIKDADWKLAGQVWHITERLYPHLDDSSRLTADNAGVHHFSKLRDVTGLKKVGYRLAQRQMSISDSTMAKMDRELFDEAMKPFLTGKRDSTKIPNFSTEKRLVASQFSANVAVLLYTVANAFQQVLPANDPARRDALIWAKRAAAIRPQPVYTDLVHQLEGSK